MSFTKRKWCRLSRDLGTAILCAALALPAFASDGNQAEAIASFTKAAGSRVKVYGHVSLGYYGIHADIYLENLAPGTTYAVWFAYVDKPEACSFTGCAEPDLSVADPAGVSSTGVFGRIDKVLAGSNGASFFATDIRDLMLSNQAMVWLVVVEGGCAGKGNRLAARQLLTLEETPGDDGHFLRYKDVGGLAYPHAPLLPHTCGISSP